MMISARRFTSMNTAIAYILISVVGGAVGQILLKHGMNKMPSITLSANQFLRVIWQMGTNIYVFLGLAIYVLSVVFWLAALSRVDLSYAYPFASMSYIVMLTASWILFHENITLLRVAGTLVICIGVILIARSA
jgi:drug/metabolite transporter (DMT)-like permease